MRRSLLFLFLLCLPLACFGQNSEYKGVYHAVSLNFLTDDKFATDFEVADDGAISGKFLLGEQKTPVAGDLKGKVDGSGKFEAEAIDADGAVYAVRGVLPKASKDRMTIKLSRKTVVASKGKKQVSEFELMGFIGRIDAQTTPKKALGEAVFADTGKTFLKIDAIDSVESFFGNTWENMSVASSLDTKTAGKTYRILELKTESGDALRKLRFALLLEPDKKEFVVESGKNWTVTYKEAKGGAEKFLFVAESGSVSIFSDSDTETVWLIDNLVLRNTRKTERVKISGYIHARK